jgi:fructose-bisphosphate aldolase class II
MRKYVALTKKVVEYAHSKGVVVEASSRPPRRDRGRRQRFGKGFLLYRPGQVEDFVTRTGRRLLAIAIGTSHGGL